MASQRSPRNVHLFEAGSLTCIAPNNLMNKQPADTRPSVHAKQQKEDGIGAYLSRELALVAAQTAGKPFDATLPYCDPKIIRECCEKHFKKFDLPRFVRCDNRMIGLIYKFTLVKGKFSLHYAWLWNKKIFFSFKLDQRDLSLVRRDQEIRSKLVGIDTPRVIHAERQGSHCITVIEPMALNLKNFMDDLRNKKCSPHFYFGVLLRTGIHCVRYLQRLHQNGYLHANINPQTFVFAYRPNGPKGLVDFERGPLIIDYAYAINWKQDPIYELKNPEKTFSNSLSPGQGGMYTRRDDMENLAYVLLFLSKGFVRWEIRKHRDHVMFDKKCLSDLTKYMKGIPIRFRNYLNYIRILKWNEEPDYDLLQKILSENNLDIKNEIKIRREQRRVEKQRNRRRHLARGKLVANNRDNEKHDPELEGPSRIHNDNNMGENGTQNDLALPADGMQHPGLTCELPLAFENQQHLPLGMGSGVLMDIEDARADGQEERLQKPRCSFCQNEEEDHNPTLKQCLDLNTCNAYQLQEMLVYGRPDPFASEQFECPHLEAIQTGAVAELFPCREGSDIWEDTMMADIIYNQNVLPARRLGPRVEPVKMPNRVGTSSLPCDILGQNVLQSFPFLPWEVDRNQQHPWEEEMSNCSSKRRKTVSLRKPASS